MFLHDRSKNSPFQALKKHPLSGMEDSYQHDNCFSIKYRESTLNCPKNNFLT